MDITRKLGIMIFSAVPAIIGGGISFVAFHNSYIALVIFELLLMFTVYKIVKD